MAKSHGFHGVFSGKVGGNVYFRNKASKMKQGVRTYVANPTNPKSLSQAEQRMRMAPAVNCYRALKDIIDRGFQGRQYGNESRLRFLSLAMKREGGPYLMKGNKSFVPGSFQISEGSLIPITIYGLTQIQGASLWPAIKADLMTSVPGSTATIADFTANLIALNTDVQEGDQITFVFILQSQTKVISIILDTTNTATLRDYGLSAAAFENYAAYFPYNSVEPILAAAVIHSREGESGQHMRSNAIMFVDTANAAVAPFYTDAARVDAIASYMASASSVDWPEVPELVSRDFANLVMVTVPRQNAQGVNRYTVRTAEGPAEVQPTQLQMLGYMSTSGNIGILYEDVEVEEGGEHAFYPLAADATRLTYNSNEVELNGTDAYSEIDLVYNSKYGHL